MQSKKGFTLIELLVVIAIIAILAAILFPVFIMAKNRGTQTRCLANLKQLGTAMRLYADDNGGFLPSSCPVYGVPDWCGCRYVADPAPQIDTQGVIWRYTKKSKALYACPTDKKLRAKEIGNITNYPLSYSMNDSLHHRNTDSVIGRQTRILLFIHEARDKINDGNFNWASGFDKPSDVHWGGTTLVYLDGHARWGSLNSLMKELNDRWWDPDSKK